MKTITDFINYLTYHVNRSIYIWGGSGQQPPFLCPDWIRKVEQSKSYADKAIKLFNKRLAQFGNDFMAFDCSGFIVKFLLDNQLIKSDSTAKGLYFNYCSNISIKADLRAGDLVFRKDDDGDICHVGVACGDGYVIHCKGRDYGVVREKLNSSWVLAGRLRCLTLGGGYNFPSWYTGKTLKKSLLFNAQVVGLQNDLKALGYYKDKIDGKFGSLTFAAVRAFQKDNKLEVDGIVGNQTAKQLYLVMMNK